MTNHKALLAIVAVFGLIGMIRGLDSFVPGDVDFMLVNVNNGGNEDLDDLQVKVLIYDLGVVLQTNELDLDDHGTAGNLLYWDVPNDAKPGDYWVRITVSNADVREVKHRLITIV